MITITIKGMTGSGKTTLALAIEDLLAQHGVIVENEDRDVVDDRGNDELLVRRHQAERMQCLRARLVRIETVQLRKDQR